MTTRNEYIASIMLEAADLLQMDESAGANGAAARFYDEKIKKQKDKIKSLEKKAKAYERAGYSDRGPAKEIKDLKDKIEFYKNQKENMSSKRDYDPELSGRRDREKKATASKQGKTIRTWRDGILGRYDKHEYGHDYVDAYHKNDKLREEKAKKNARINKRVAMKEAIDLLYDKAMECDTIDEATEYIDKAEQLELLIEIDE